MVIGLVVATLMLTPWGEKVSSENCWREYPRPQLVRTGNWECLNGDWNYAITAISNQCVRPPRWEGRIRVPFALEAPLSGMVNRMLEPHEYLWYRRTIRLDPKPGERILLHFCGVDCRANVFLGHDEVGFHEGGQLPFTVDLTPYAKPGENELVVLVWDPTEMGIQSRGKQAFDTFACFYTRMSGIWQTVWLETVPETYVSDYAVTTDIDKGEVTIDLKVSGDGEVDPSLTLYDAENRDVGQLLSSSRRGSFTFAIPSPHLWSPEDPYLYVFKVTCGKDEGRGYFGMRKFAKGRDKDGKLRFFLNNRPYFLLGTLDQGWWPDGLLTPPSDAAMVFDIETLKRCGYNMMRKHIKIEPLRYYYHCDRIGLIVLQDLPCSRTGMPPSRKDFNRDPWDWRTTIGYGQYRAELKGMVDLLRKVPSIVMWIPYNEAWGQHDRMLTHTTLDWLKHYDPTRLVDGPSGWADFEGGHIRNPKGSDSARTQTSHLAESACEAADVIDMHVYRGPDMFPANDRRISFLGEFGGLGHPVEGHLWSESDQGARYRAANGTRGNWGYGGIADTKTREGLESAYCDLMRKLLPLKAQGLAGAVYTQTTDVEIEINGLMTYDRRVLKMNPSVLAEQHARVIGGNGR